jgi:hypothetical protein
MIIFHSSFAIFHLSLGALVHQMENDKWKTENLLLLNLLPLYQFSFLPLLA